MTLYFFLFFFFSFFSFFIKRFSTKISFFGIPDFLSLLSVMVHAVGFLSLSLKSLQIVSCMFIYLSTNSLTRFLPKFSYQDCPKSFVVQQQTLTGTCLWKIHLPISLNVIYFLFVASKTATPEKITVFINDFY